MPITGKSKPPQDLTAEVILKKITEYDIYKMYCPVPFTLGRSFSSPLRHDDNPSFVIKVSKESGYIYHMDFVNPDHTGNSFQFVQQLFTHADGTHLKYNEALEKINRDFQLGIGPGTIEGNYKAITAKYEQPTELVLPPFISVIPRLFSSEETRYWNDYHISSDECRQYDIYAIRQLYINGKRITNPQNRLRFAYRYEYEGKELWKIYTPLIAKECGYKWFTNVPGGTMEGLETLKRNKPCILTKSRKDRIVLSKFMKSVGAAQNESEVSIPSNIINRIQNYNIDCYVGFDADAVGKKKAQFYVEQYGLKSFTIPDNIVTENCKDFSDMCKLYGPESIKNLLISNNLIN